MFRNTVKYDQLVVPIKYNSLLKRLLVCFKTRLKQFQWGIMINNAADEGCLP
ncbi:hypothetical protein SAMN04487941_4108 [Pontibacter akesuensis]|uniref:Uncharacterized protein n=1 Tax=Pontibacter akesuensis TaxID=388950 RepID=A0A1I7KU79_9BACT|nr:hypothetical protein SAMN04487941_4108 [Pontibacter akesuensis]